MASPPPELLTVEQAAELLSVSRSTLYRMLREGIVGSAKHGSGAGRLVVPREEVDYYLSSLKAAATKRTVS